jgi:hypothetical protein
MTDAGILPEIPEEIQGRELNIEFISTLAQAQRAVAAGGSDRLLGTVTQLAAVKPDIIDKVNFDQIVDDYAELFGVNPKLVVPDDEVAEIRAARAQQQAAVQAGAAVPEMAKAAKSMGDVNVDNMRDVLNQFQGYGSPSASEIG